MKGVCNWLRYFGTQPFENFDNSICSLNGERNKISKWVKNDVFCSLQLARNERFVIVSACNILISAACVRIPILNLNYSFRFFFLLFSSLTMNDTHIHNLTGGKIFNEFSFPLRRTHELFFRCTINLFLFVVFSQRMICNNRFCHVLALNSISNYKVQPVLPGNLTSWGDLYIFFLSTNNKWNCMMHIAMNVVCKKNP